MFVIIGWLLFVFWYYYFDIYYVFFEFFDVCLLFVLFLIIEFIKFWYWNIFFCLFSLLFVLFLVKVWWLVKLLIIFLMFSDVNGCWFGLGVVLSSVFWSLVMLICLLLLLLNVEKVDRSLVLGDRVVRDFVIEFMNKVIVIVCGIEGGKNWVIFDVFDGRFYIIVRWLC